MQYEFDSPKILFVQKSEVLNTQRAEVLEFFAKNIPDATLTFASGPDDIIPGEQVDILITPTLDTLDEIIVRLNGLRWIHFLSAGVEKIWPMQFDKTKYLLSKSSGVHGVTMSEFAIGAMLYFEKSFNKFVEQSRSKEWQRFWLGELTGKNLVILGLGHIGSEIAKRASAFDMHISATATTTRDVSGVETIVPLNEVGILTANADYIVVCLPLTEQTRGCVDEAFIRSCKPGAVIIDISRGGVVLENAILRGLEEDILKGAALDVFETQPLPSKSKLWNNPRVLLTPHVSGTTQEYLSKALYIFKSNLESLESTGSTSTPVSVGKMY
ncbi:MAG: D-2-hydroxyacid dehydrogenase [Idiomarina sp.]|nr:D-2-hydroxyacid dehydrogenase [Idiomarina sp.]